MDITLDLIPGTALHLPPQHRLHLQLLSGRLWLTRSGDAGDHFVTAGSAVAVDGREQVVVECDGPGPARLQLLVQGRSPWSLRRWWRQGPGLQRPTGLQDLDVHQLRDIGAPPAWLQAAQAQAQAQRQQWALSQLLGAA